MRTAQHPTSSRTCLKALYHEFEVVAHSVQQNQYGHQHHHRTDNPVDQPYSAHIEFVPHLVDQPCQQEPPPHGTHNNEEVADDLKQRTVGQDERHLTIHGDEKEYDERIGYRD